ncbi:MAG: hypothetical protein HZR80_15790 [Candidatus Heimdallarchaeota archaeon]
MTEVFYMDLEQIQPSQLYISKRKLRKIQKAIDPTDVSTLEVVPIKKLGSDIIYTDGHTRAYAAYLAGITRIRVEWETEDLDWEMYEICVGWCKEAGIFTVVDFKGREIDQKSYRKLWYKRCALMQNEINENRMKV